MLSTRSIWGCGLVLVLGLVTEAGADFKAQLKATEETLAKLQKNPKNFDGMEVTLTGFYFPDDGPSAKPIAGTKLQSVSLNFLSANSEGQSFDSSQKLTGRINFVTSPSILGGFDAFKKKQNKKTGDPQFEITCTIRKQGNAWVAKVTQLKVYALGRKNINPEVIK